MTYEKALLSEASPIKPKPKEKSDMVYQIQPGDTIAKVTHLLKTNWETLSRLNPHAVGRSSKTGNWFLKNGAKLTIEKTFDSELKKTQERHKADEKRATSPENGKWIEYTVKPGDTLWSLAVKRFHVNLDELMKHNNITDPGKIYPGQKIRIPIPEHPQKQEVVASWYGGEYHGKPMANGDIFEMHADTIAHKDLPFGTRVELKNPETGQTVRAVVTDRGPFVAGRDVDLSYGLAKKLSLVNKGVGKLIMRII